MSSIHELLKQVYPLKLRMELFNAIWTGWRADIKEKDQRIAELEEQLKNAIVPKYKTGDKVYGIIDTWAYTDVFPVEIRGNHLLYEVWDGEDTTKQHSTRIFATKEEAEAKLRELQEK